MSHIWLLAAQLVVRRTPERAAERAVRPAVVRIPSPVSSVKVGSDLTSLPLHAQLAGLGERRHKGCRAQRFRRAIDMIDILIHIDFKLCYATESALFLCLFSDFGVFRLIDSAIARGVGSGGNSYQTFLPEDGNLRRQSPRDMQCEA